MIIVQLRNIVCRRAMGIDSALVISWDIGSSDVDMWVLELLHSLRRLLDDADFFVGQAVEIGDPLVDFCYPQKARFDPHFSLCYWNSRYPQSALSKYFESRLSKAGLVPSKTSTIALLMSGFSMAPDVYRIS